jgi:electron transfer flavoprotein alpha subunit
METMDKDIFILIEHLQGQLAEISWVMLAAGRSVTQETGGEVVAVLLGDNAQALSEELNADKVFYVESPALAEFTSDAYQMVLENLIQEHGPRAVLFGDTSIGADVAGGLSVKLGLPLVSGCRSFSTEGGVTKYISQIYGGKVGAEGELSAPTTLVTMIPGGYKADEGMSTEAPEVVTIDAPSLEGIRVTLKEYIEPEVTDVDISKEDLLIAVGRGIQREDNLELAEELAEALGGAVCSSRPVVDQGWLPTSRMVGKSGKSVKPTLYLALGISGAPEHMEGVSDSDLIIAINTDPAAPIFERAQYGADLDLLDLLPELTEKVQEAKGG